MRLLIVIHRWLCAALCVILTLWFLSGIVMMYWSYPSVSAGDALSRLPVLDGSRIRVSPVEAFARFDWQPASVYLTMFDGRPAYVGGGHTI